MINKLLVGLPSLLLPLGLYGVPAQSSTSYQRSYLSASINSSPNMSATNMAAIRIVRDAVLADELEIVSASPVKELVIVDAAVPDKAVFYRGVKPGVDIVEIDSSQPGLPQLKQIISSYKNLTALHIVSHAAAGELHLGNSKVNAALLKQEIDTFSGLKNALVDGADLLLYGCDLASGDSGEELLEIIRSNTGLDVAASTNKTGNADSGGDWDLEIQQGDIQSALAFSPKALADFSGVLAPFTGTIDFGDSVNVGAYGSDYNGLPKGDGSINATFTAGDYVLVFDGQDYSTAARDYGPAATYAYTSEGESAATLRFEGGPTFTANSINLVNSSGYTDTFTVTGSAGGSVTGITINNGGNQTVDLSSLSPGATSITVTVNDGDGFFYVDEFTVADVGGGNSAPTTSNLNSDSVAWAGVGNTVSLDASGNANLADTELDALNAANGNWADATLTVQRSSTAITSDIFGFNTSGALFTDTGSALQSGGQTFATYTNTNGVLTITFTSSGTTATSALVDNVAQRITYRSDTPAGDATVSYTLTDGDGGTATVANLTVTSDTIYVTNTTDTATIDITNGVSFSEAVAIAAADATGSQTIVFNSTLASTALTINSVSLNESLTIDMDSANGMSLTSGTITLGAATTQTFTNGSGDTASLTGAITGSGALTKAGAGGLSLSAVNAWSGATTISAGTLTVSGGDAISSNSSVSVASGATFALSNNETIGNLSGAGAVTLGSNTLTSIITADTTFSGGISGTGGLSLSQSGAATFALTLSGTNTYTGSTTAVNFAWLKLNGDASVSSSSYLRANGNSVITLLSDQTVGSLGSNSATATVNLGSFTLSAGGDNTSPTVAGVISGTGNLVKQGSGTLTLTGTNTYSGTTTVSAGTLSVASDSNLGSNSVTLASGATLDITGATNIDNAIALSGDATVSTSANATLSGVVSGANTLTKAGSSTLTLSNTNTYAGTSISAGTLSVAGDNNLGSGTVTLASGSTLEVTGASNIDNAIALTGNATISNSANATLSGVISGANTLTKAGASTLTLSNTNTYAGTTVSAGTLSVASDANLGSGTVTLGSGSTLAITGAITIDNPIALTGNATINTSANAILSGVISGGFNLSKSGASTLTLSATNTYSGTTTVSAGTLNFASDSNLGSGGLTLAAGSTLVLTGATTIDNAITLSGATTLNTTADATISGNIGGVGSLAKTGANTLTLSGTNSYAGTTTVSAGTLSIASDGNLGSSTVTLATGTTLAVTGATTIDNAIALSGNATVQATNAATLSGAISGAGGLSKTGVGTVTLSGSNGFTGNVAVSAGGLTLSGGAAIDNNSAVTMSSGTTLTLSSSETIGSLAGAGSVALGANTLTMGGDNSSTSYSGNISGTGGGITKAGAGTLTLSGTNSNTGATTISAGTIDAQNGDAIGDASAVSVASGAFLVLSAAETTGSLAGAGTATLGGNTLTTGGNNASTTFSGAITGSNGMVKTGSGTLTLSNTGNESTLSGGMTISAGTVSISDDDQMAAGTLTLNGGTLSLDGPTVFDNNIDLTANSTINSGGNAIASGVISGAGDLTKTGSLSLQFTNTNTYTGATFVNAGYLLANNADSLGSTAGATTVASGATLYLSGSFTLAEALNLAGTGTAGNGAIYAPSGSSTITGLALLTDNTTIIHDGDLTFSAGITDVAGSYSLIKNGTGTLTLSDTASYDGTTTISSGSLSIGSDSHIGSGALTLATGTTLAVTGATTIDNAIVLSGGTATVNTSAITTMSGNITGAGGLTKAGASILTLSGTDSYSGATNVNAGSLLVNGALSATSNTAVASAATLGGSGTISSNVTVNSGGTLSPGNSAGSITVNGNLTMASGSTLAVEINGAVAGTEYDQVIVNGTVDVSGATLSATHGYVPGSGDIYTIIANDAADAVTGNFSGVSEGSTLVAGGNSTVLTASYIGATGNDFTLTAPIVPTVNSVSIVEANGTYHIGDSITIAVEFSEQIFLSTGTIQLTLETGATDRALSYLAGSGSSTLYFSYTVQEGDNSSDLDYVSTSGLAANGDTIQGATFIDAILTLPTPGAANSLAANKDIVIDGVRPTASIVVADTALAAGETSTVTITFSEAVTGFATGDLTVANGVVSGLSTGDGGITWTATLTPTASTTDATNLITLDNTGVADAVGNTGTGTTDSNNYAIDTLRPTASIVVADTALAVGETSTVTITFNEAVTGLTTGDFTVANGALSGLSSGDGGITWTATFTPTAGVEDATNLITLDNTGVVDAAGNTGTGTTDSNNYALDGARPTASIVVADTALAAGETSTVTITFSEAVSGLATGDFSVANGALSGLSTGDGGITWTATLTPTASVEDTTNLITLDNTGVADVGGNTGTGTTDSNNYAIDTLRPTASIVVADTALAVGETSTVTITFSEAISGLAIGDFTVANGALSGLSSGDGGITWTATFTPTASVTDTTNVITLDNTGVADAAGNTGSGTTDSNNYAIDSSSPTASIVVADTALAAGETSTVTITFSEAVTGVAIGDFTVANGALSGLSTGDGGITWTATLTPTVSISDTTNLITLDNTGVQDAAGNAGTGTTDSNNYAIDTLRPTASIVVADTALAAGETSTVTITFSEAVSGLATGDFSVANGALSGLSSGDGGITWTATLTPTASVEDTTNLITLDNTGVADAGGNTGTGTTDSNNYAIDTLRPTASIVVADTALAVGETSTVTITFSEAISGLAIGDFTVANGALSGLSSGDGGITWTATFTPTASVTDTTNVITLDNTGVADAAGNTGSGTTDSNNYAIDSSSPTASIVIADTALAAGETSTVTITFSEAVSGLAIGDFTVANGVLSSLSTGDGGITWTATLTPTASILDTTNLITLDNTGVTDAAGNAGTGTTDSNNYAIDTLRPTASIVVADTALAAGETSTVTITFSEAVSGLAIGDFTVANGALSSLSSGDGGITWTATLTPTASVEDSSNLITLDNTGVADAAGNTGSGTTDSNNYAIDSARPTASIVVADTALAAGETSTVTITFSEAVSGLAIGDFTVANGALSSLSTGDGGITWTATLTPTASISDTTNIITLDNTGVTDAAGNAGTGTTDSNNYAIDSSRPTASIVVADTALAAGETSSVTITFSEAVSGLAIGDFTVANGALNSLSSGDGGITWTATLTPTASIEDMTNIITLDNTGVADAAGNAGTGTTDSNNYAIDTLRPTASIVVADTALAIGETSLVTITFSEAVTGFANDDLTIANGVLTAVSSGDGGITWTATFTPTASITDTTNLITLDNTGVTDAAGNAGTGTTDSNNYAIDSAHPTASVVVADTALAVGETSLVTITFSEAVTGFTNADLTIANGTLTAVSSGDGGITWTATFTPTASIEDTTNVITLDNTGVTDLAGNAGTGTTDSNNYAIDTTSATASIVVADTALAVGETSTVTITFSEAVSGLAIGDFTVANGALSSLSSGDGGITWTATLTPTASIEDTTNIITLDNTGVADGAGNAGTGTTDSNNYAIDTLRPTSSIVVADTALAVGETSLVTFTFSEAVTGFTHADLTIPNGTLGTVTSGDGGITWTATFTPTASITDATNLITLDNTGVTDAAGNAGSGTTDSNNYAIDSQPATAAIVVADTALRIGETSSVTITFSEAVTGLTTADFTIANGVLSGVMSGDGGITWTATLTPNASVEDATNIITLDNTGVADVAGNAGTGITDSNNYAIDTVRPAITGSITVSDIALKTGDTATVTFTFTEAVTGFTTADLTVGNGVVSSLSTSDGGITWIATLTPNASVSAATNVITLDLSGILDAAGNAGTGTADSVNYAIDTSNPTVASVGVPVDGIYTEGQVLDFTVNTDSAITVDTTGGTPRIALTIGADTRYANYVSGSGSSALVFSYTVQANDNDADGIALAASIDANSSTLRDAADNDITLTLNSVAVTTGVLVDTAAPADPVVTTPAAAVDTNAVEYAVIGTHEEEGATISLYLDADNNGVADNATVVDSAVVASGNWSLTAPLVSDTANNFVVIAEDTAGNVSAAVDVSTILQDSIAPAAPVALDMQDASDTGVSATDNLTNSTTPTVTGTAEANATVTLTSDVDGEVGTATANDTGNWTITTSVLSAGTHNLTATATDAAANTGIASSALAVTIDTSLPTVGTVANQELIALASTDALAVAVGDDNTTAANLVLTSTSSNINVVALEGVVLGGSDANRTVTVTALATGTSTITLTVEDEAGNTASSSFTVGVNAAPTISGVPAATVDQGTAYSFMPTALDGDSDTLVFSITNQPAWAAFDTATGALTGTPTRANVGITSGIVISVTDGVEAASLPAFAIEVFDSTAPALTAPADLELDATALYTPVSLKRLVGLDEEATQEALDAAIADLATDSADGNACCTTAPEDLTDNNNFLLTPGRHEIVWKTTNGEGLTAEATQVVDIRPIVSFSKSQVAIRGSDVSFRIILNGKSPTYPLTIPYVIDESTTAQPEEHTLVNGQAVFEEGQFSVTIPVTLNAGTGESQLAVRFGDDDINEGVANSHVISIREGNIPPVVSLSIQQDGLNTSLITPTGGLVTVMATVTDLNQGDTHTFDWSATTGLADTDGNLTDATRVLDPTDVTGSRQVVVTVTDSEGASVQASAYFRVVTDLPVLEDDTDTDSDGIDDVLEGTGDADDNGIPDYLDNMPSPNILPQRGNTTNAYLIECDPGVRCGLGLFARGGSSGGVQILDDELTTIEGLTVDPTFAPAGGIFDFAVRDLPTPGQSVRVVVPQRAAIPADAVYRKFQNGQWVSFVVDANNAIHSAAGNPGYCPPPGTSDWTPGLTEGHLCVQLTIEDGGANDDDGLVNSAVVDPGVVSTLIYVEPPIVPPVEIKSKGGGAMGGFWLILLGGLMAIKRIGLKGGALVLLLLASFNSSAKSSESEVSKNYLRLDLFQARGDQSQADFQRGLERAGYDVTVTRYDINRIGGQIAFGRQWTDFTYSELGYMDLRDVTVDLLIAGDTDIVAFERELDKHYPTSANGITLVQGFTHALDNYWDLSAELGVFMWEEGIDFNTTQVDLKNDDGVDLLLGLQLSYQLADDSRLGVSLRRINLDGQHTDVIGFTGRLHF